MKNSLKSWPLNRFLVCSLILSVFAFLLTEKFLTTEKLSNALLPFRTIAIDGYLDSAALSADGKYLAATHEMYSRWDGTYASGLHLTVWEVESNQEVFDKRLDSAFRRSVLKFSRNGDSLLLQGTKIELPFIRAEKRGGDFEPSKNEILYARSKNGRYSIFGLRDSQFYIRENYVRDATDGAKYPIETVKGGGEDWASCRFAPGDETIYTVNRKLGKPVFWNASDGKLRDAPFAIPERPFPLSGMTVSEDGNLLATTWQDETVLVTSMTASPQTPRTLHSFVFPGDDFQSVFFLDGDRFVAVSGGSFHSLPAKWRPLNPKWRDPHDPLTTMHPQTSVWDLHTDRHISWDGFGRVSRRGFAVHDSGKAGEKLDHVLHDLRTDKRWYLKTVVSGDSMLYEFAGAGQFVMDRTHVRGEANDSRTEVHLWKVPRR